jgi:hypothetical protein
LAGCAIDEAEVFKNIGPVVALGDAGADARFHGVAVHEARHVGAERTAGTGARGVGQGIVSFVRLRESAMATVHDGRRHDISINSISAAPAQ